MTTNQKRKPNPKDAHRKAADSQRQSKHLRPESSKLSGTVVPNSRFYGNENYGYDREPCRDWPTHQIEYKEKCIDFSSNAVVPRDSDLFGGAREASQCSEQCYYRDAFND